MKTIKTELNDIICVEVPKEYNKYNKYIPRFLITLRISFIDNDGYWHSWDIEEIDEKFIRTNKLNILGKLSQLKDEDVERFVELLHGNFYMEEIKVWSGKLYKNYNQKSGLMNKIYRTAKQSFISLLESNGVDTSKESDLLIIEML